MMGVSSFAQEAAIYLEGVGTQEQVAFFRDSFAVEIPAYGYRLADSPQNADYSIRYVISPQGRMFTLEASIIRLEDQFTLASNSYYFEYLEDMLPYNQLLIFTLVSNIPQAEVAVAEDDSWRNKWLYLRASVDFPISFYTLKGTGLYNNNTIFTGEITSNPDDLGYVMLIDNRTVARPAITLGFEVQFLNFLSLEPFFQANWDSMNDNNFFSFAAGLELKFPLKFIKHVMFEPYIAGVYPLPFYIPSSATDIFKSLSKFTFGVGGGLQLSIKRGKSDAIFLDLSYMYYIGDTVVKNHYKSENTTVEFKPSEIHFQRTVIRLGVGYKFGFINRKK
jgi:opacity protein-like surface antigen